MQHENELSDIVFLTNCLKILQTLLCPFSEANNIEVHVQCLPVKSRKKVTTTSAAYFSNDAYMRRLLASSPQGD